MDNKKARILLCEDDEFIRKSYAARLKAEGYEPILAINGEEASQKIVSEKPDLVLLDIMMPVKDGFTVLKEAKENGEIKDIPIVVFSNLGQETDIQEAMSLGAVDYLTKSNLTMKEMIAKIEEHLSQ